MSAASRAATPDDEVQPRPDVAHHVARSFIQRCAHQWTSEQRAELVTLLQVAEA